MSRNAAENRPSMTECGQRLSPGSSCLTCTSITACRSSLGGASHALNHHDLMRCTTNSWCAQSRKPGALHPSPLKARLCASDSDSRWGTHHRPPPPKDLRKRRLSSAWVETFEADEKARSR
eukprot:354069-Chlamydomonas_euryale.AAC.28